MSSHSFYPQHPKMRADAGADIQAGRGSSWLETVLDPTPPPQSPVSPVSLGDRPAWLLTPPQPTSEWHPSLARDEFPENYRPRGGHDPWPSSVGDGSNWRRTVLAERSHCPLPLQPTRYPHHSPNQYQQHHKDGWGADMPSPTHSDTSPPPLPHPPPLLPHASLPPPLRLLAPLFRRPEDTPRRPRAARLRHLQSVVQPRV
ncbi:uncharacterized protein VTP21DRAFT_11281 [Calcarisporiella thermophila]|uniref:uncharacterized protein n=1 Tax=Calcarisporiella thermophila TaxID=911321 RepID=UPI00374365EE